MAEQQNSLKIHRLPFTQVPNDLLCSDQISGMAKALWCVFYSKPDNWTFYWREIESNFKEGREAVRNAAKQLEKMGYLKKTQKKINSGRGVVFGGMEIELFPYPNQQTQPSGSNTGFPHTRNSDTSQSDSSDTNPSKPDTYKDLPKPKLSNQKIPKPGKGIFSEVSEGKGWEEQKILDALDEEALIKIVENAPGYDLDWLIEKYLPWVREKGWPKNIKIAFPAWAGKYTKSKKVFATPTRGLSSSLSWKKPQSQAVSPDLVILRIKSVLSPENWEKYFAGKSLEETESGWKIIVSDPSAFEHEEVLKQIKVEIKCQK